MPLILSELIPLTNARLRTVARQHGNDIQDLNLILQVLEMRTSETRLPVIHWIRERMAELSATEIKQPAPKPSKVWKYAAALAGIIAVGVGQAMGGELWKAIWPKVEPLVGRFF